MLGWLRELKMIASFRMFATVASGRWIEPPAVSANTVFTATVLFLYVALNTVP